VIQPFFRFFLGLAGRLAADNLAAAPSAPGWWLRRWRDGQPPRLHGWLYPQYGARVDRMD
jgi:hypothetical protein